jgi:hypothetical protein
MPSLFSKISSYIQHFALAYQEDEEEDGGTVM